MISGSEQSSTAPTTRTATTTATRRTLLTAGAATAATLLAGASAAQASDSTSTSTSTDVTTGLRALEEQHSARVGVFAHHLGTKKTVVHRADELFPMCSVFKTLAAAAVLRDLDRHGEVLYKVVHYTEADLVDGSDQTRAHLADGMTVEQLADVAIRFSDNGAGNLILRELGGPTAVTRFARSLGDRVTRLDRWETELNSAEPDRITDTTSPRAIMRPVRQARPRRRPAPPRPRPAHRLAAQQHDERRPFPRRAPRDLDDRRQDGQRRLRHRQRRRHRLDGGR